MRNWSLLTVAALALGLWIGPAPVSDGDAAGIRNSGPRPSFIPRSGAEGVSPGTFGRYQPLQGGISRSGPSLRSLGLDRGKLRATRPPITESRPPAPSNRLTDRLYPDVKPLGNLPLTPVPATPGLTSEPAPPLDKADADDVVEPFAHIDRNMR